MNITREAVYIRMPIYLIGATFIILCKSYLKYLLEQHIFLFSESLLVLLTPALMTSLVQLSLHQTIWVLVLLKNMLICVTIDFLETTNVCEAINTFLFKIFNPCWSASSVQMMMYGLESVCRICTI